MAEKPFRSTLSVISHVTHYSSDGRLHAFGPYAREIDIWADLFDNVVIAAPCRHATPPGDNIPFTRSNISIAPQLEVGGETVGAKLRLALSLPRIIVGLCQAIRRAGVVHVRCPGSFGLLGAVLAPMFRKPHIAKFAGEWPGYAGEPWTVRVQRAILRSPWWRRGLVTVYGEWPDQAPQIVPFFTSIMTKDQVASAATTAVRKRLERPPRIIYAGRLARTKHVDLLITAARLLRDQGIDLEVIIIGDGPERGRLERLTESCRLEDCISFAGALPYEEVMHWYRRGHVLVLPSSHEGWPKVLPEAMCHGLVCVSTEHGFVSEMLKGRGLLFPIGDAPALASCLERAFADPGLYAELSRAGAEWAARHSLEDLRDALRDLMDSKWCLSE